MDQFNQPHVQNRWVWIPYQVQARSSTIHPTFAGKTPCYAGEEWGRESGVLPLVCLMRFSVHYLMYLISPTVLFSFLCLLDSYVHSRLGDFQVLNGAKKQKLRTASVMPR
jgi:hypothetical protein